MKQRWEIIFSGVGGQGLLLSGIILGTAASVIEKRQAVMTSTYGIETRRTFTKADLIISEEYIDFPEALEPDVVVALAPVAYERYVGSLGEKTILIYDADEITETPSKAKQYGMNIKELAAEAGNPTGLNVVALGALVTLTGCVKPESVQKALKDRFAGDDKVVGVNEKAFNLGYEAGKKFV